MTAPQASSSRSITFVVPAFNEERALAQTVAVVRRAVEGVGLPNEIVMVDDGSTDSTAVIAGRLARELENFRAIRHEVNRGLGAAYKTGIAAARMSHVMLVPGDDAWPEEALARILQKTGEADIVIP